VHLHVHHLLDLHPVSQAKSPQHQALLAAACWGTVLGSKAPVGTVPLSLTKPACPCQDMQKLHPSCGPSVQGEGA
jgi:hypothetical protein